MIVETATEPRARAPAYVDEVPIPREVAAERAGGRLLGLEVARLVDERADPKLVHANVARAGPAPDRGAPARAPRRRERAPLTDLQRLLRPRSVAVAAAAAPAAVEEAGALGCGGAVVSAAGFAEGTGAGTAAHHDIVASTGNQAVLDAADFRAALARRTDEEET